jgi:SAM-dependent methyltransferase
MPSNLRNNNNNTANDEAQAVRQRYARRAENPALAWRYHRLNPAALWPAQERERALAAGLWRYCEQDLSRLAALRLLEVGCGSGGNLWELQRLGLQPNNLFGVELLHERHAAARALLPPQVTLWAGDALQLDLPSAHFDLVLQSTVFSSLLDEHFQTQLAQAMWRWLKPGGCIIWYDFTVNNPRNADVCGWPLKRIQALFPEGKLQAQRLTLAPPLARAAACIHPRLYTVLNTLPWLRTHVLAWIKKNQSP